MPTRQRIAELNEKPNEPMILERVDDLWARLCKYPDGCPFCGKVVPLHQFPWRYKRHDIHGHSTGGAIVCAGSRSIYTIEMLGLVVPSS